MLYFFDVVYSCVRLVCVRLKTACSNINLLPHRPWVGSRWRAPPFFNLVVRQRPERVVLEKLLTKLKLESLKNEMTPIHLDVRFWTLFGYTAPRAAAHAKAQAATQSRCGSCHRVRSPPASFFSGLRGRGGAFMSARGSAGAAQTSLARAGGAASSAWV